MPLRTWRWSRQRPPRREVIAGSKGASRSHSWSVISNRRFTTGFYRTSCPRPKPTQPSEKHALGPVGLPSGRLVAGNPEGPGAWDKDRLRAGVPADGDQPVVYGRDHAAPGAAARLL